MMLRTLLLASAVLATPLSAYAGPCSKDAGSGPTPGAAASAQSPSPQGGAGQHPPTNVMNNATGGSAASSQDANRQTKGEPTAAQQAQGAKPSAAPQTGC